MRDRSPMRLLQLLTPAYIAFSAFVLVWDVFLASRIAQLRRVPSALRTVTALAGLLLAPGLLVELAAGSLVTCITRTLAIAAKLKGGS